ncbi:class I SAM-dependent DNA methyltransferase [Saccharopolyspora sp. CA-218241]|uniref:class I SAM-dependent DNA methyltransferase n=1 Tax=Saccharopolyspora sp. CA-218241 TaxID=3240027 RepID=UPI003D984A12
MLTNAVYDDFAESYAKHSEDGPVNAYLDRPAILGLAGDLAAVPVLELGCAAGVLSEQLVARGADLIALDREPRMVELARRRVGAAARFAVTDLGRPPVPVPTGSVELVIASLVLHYVEDWGPLLAELRRCLAPGGALVFSIHHPSFDWRRHGGADYWSTALVDETWTIGGERIEVSFYRRPLASVFGALREAGFAVEAVEEPQPLPELRELDLETFSMLTAEPLLLHVRAVAPG